MLEKGIPHFQLSVILDSSTHWVGRLLNIQHQGPKTDTEVNVYGPVTGSFRLEYNYKYVQYCKSLKRCTVSLPLCT